jgi:septal ring factor EnvC (AmiA/AmiB activator)
VGDFVGILNAAAVLVALLSAAFVGLQRGRLTNLRDQLDDERKESTSLRDQRDERDRQITELKAARSEDKTRIKDLETVVKIATGEVHWQAISDLLDHHHATDQRHWEHNDDLLEQILEILVRRRPT